ncbi:tryptophan--tRNA ligase [Thermogymnomonas acidicola]|uniref:tryptophan--tRNA ligase n=1 Tax=Thermogymnomonas acidicola TaxID=399579 RepID=UPI00166BD857|nr:tryptophan--tRNA ligase [Thermogymnomonas acidicola]
MAQEKQITPWEVQGELTDTDYQKVAREFGAKIIDPELTEMIRSAAGEVHPYITNGTFFAHRDLDMLLSDYRSGKRFYLYTGRGPSGKMHLGHLIPFIFTKWLQDRFGADLLIQITDDEKFLFRDLEMEDIRKYTEENILDILSLGFRPENTHIIVDSEQAGILYNQAIRVARHINVSLARDVFGFSDSDNVGKFFFTSMQAVPAFLIPALTGRDERCLIPYAIDQDPHFLVARDVLPKIGYRKPSSIISKFMPALKGSGKMSSSDPNSGIYLDDDPKTVRKKMMKYAFSGGRATAEEQRKFGAVPEIDFAYNIYKLLEPDQGKVRKVYEEYRRGALLSGEMKQIATDKINEFLEELRARREEVRSEVDAYRFSIDKVMR